MDKVVSWVVSYCLTLLTLAAQLEVNDLRNGHIDDTEEALITLLELFLVEDLNGQDGAILDGTVVRVL